MGKARVRVGGYDIYIFVYCIFVYFIDIFYSIILSYIIILYYTFYYIFLIKKMGLTLGGYDQASSLEARFYAPVVSCYHIFARIFFARTKS